MLLAIPWVLTASATGADGAPVVVSGVTTAALSQGGDIILPLIYFSRPNPSLLRLGKPFRDKWAM